MNNPEILSYSAVKVGIKQLENLFKEFINKSFAEDLPVNFKSLKGLLNLKKQMNNQFTRFFQENLSNTLEKELGKELKSVRKKVCGDASKAERTAAFLSFKSSVKDTTSMIFREMNEKSWSLLKKKESIEELADNFFIQKLVFLEEEKIGRLGDYKPHTVNRSLTCKNSISFSFRQNTSRLNQRKSVGNTVVEISNTLRDAFKDFTVDADHILNKLKTRIPKGDFLYFARKWSLLNEQGKYINSLCDKATRNSSELQDCVLVKSLKRQIALLEEEHSKLTSIITTQDKSIKSHENSLTELTAELELKNQVIEESSDKIEHLQEEYLSFQQDYLEFAKLIKNNQKANSDSPVEIRVTTVQSILKHFFLDFEAIQSNIFLLHNEKVSKLEDKFEQFSPDVLRRIAELRGKYSHTQRAISIIESDYSQLIQTHSNAKQVISELSDLRQEYKKLQHMLKVKNDEIEKLGNQLLEVEADNRSELFRSQLEEHDKFQQEVVKLLEINAKLRLSVEQKEKFIEDQANLIESFEEELEKYSAMKARRPGLKSPDYQSESNSSLRNLDLETKSIHASPQGDQDPRDAEIERIKEFYTENSKILSDSLKESQENNTILEDQLEIRKVKYKDAKIALSTTQYELGTLMEEKIALEQYLSELELVISTLKVEKHTEEVSQQTDQDETKEKLESLASELALLQKNLLDKDLELENTWKAVKTAMEKANEKETEIFYLELEQKRKTEELQLQIKRSRTENEMLTNIYENEIHELNMKSSEYGEEIFLQNSQISKLKSSLETSSTANSRLLTKLGNTEKELEEIKELRAKYIYGITEIKQTDTELTNAKSTIAELQRRAAELTASKNLMSAQIQHLTLEHQEQLSKLRDSSPRKMQKLQMESTVLQEEIRRKQSTIEEQSGKIDQLRNILASKQTTVFSSTTPQPHPEKKSSQDTRAETNKPQIELPEQELLLLIDHSEKLVSSCCHELGINDGSALLFSIKDLKIDQEKTSKQLLEYSELFEEIKHSLNLEHQDNYYVCRAVETLKLNENLAIQSVIKEFYNDFLTKIKELSENSKVKTEVISQKLSHMMYSLPKKPTVIASNPLERYCIYSLSMKIEVLQSEIQEKTKLLQTIKDSIGVSDENRILPRIKDLCKSKSKIPVPSRLPIPKYKK